MSPVSILIPALVKSEQALQWLSDCLHSCTLQTDDVLVWDDGSEQDLSQLYARHPKVRFFNVGGEHVGKSYARNRLAERAVYHLIYPVDADDVLVADALSTLCDNWRGTPLYSYIIHLHPGNVTETKVLLPFDCDAIQKHCITSVNVLHTKKQWYALGGWNDSINLYEDWEYNARLMWRFCGRRIEKPLVYYRQHPNQSTKSISKGTNQQALDTVKSLIHDYIRRNMMGCCGNRRSGTKVTNTPTAALSQKMVGAPNASLKVDVTQLGDPGPGKVWARYVGGNGMGPHERRGMTTRKRYKVVYGGTYAVMERDAISLDRLQKGAPSCGFVKLQHVSTHKPHVAPPPPLPPLPVPVPIVEKEEISEPVMRRQPVVRKTKPLYEDMEELVEGVQSATITVQRLKTLFSIYTFDENMLRVLLVAEQAGKNRIGAIKLMEHARSV